MPVIPTTAARKTTAEKPSQYNTTVAATISKEYAMNPLQFLIPLEVVIPSFFAFVVPVEIFTTYLKTWQSCMAVLMSRTLHPLRLPSEA